MSIKDKYEVRSIDPLITRDWILNKHYAKRLPSISYAFGLYDSTNIMQGACTFGRPMAMPLIQSCFGGDYQECFLELNRLVVNDGLEKNTLSFFVSQCLSMLPRPNVVVSYADTAQNHHGYIYQATNWYYSGLSAEFKDYMVKGLEHMHGASIMDMVGRSDGNAGHLDKVQLLKQRFGEENVYMIDRPQKHRYFYFLGDKKTVKDMLSKIKYPRLPYPKGDNIRYDASYKPATQGILF